MVLVKQIFFVSILLCFGNIVFAQPNTSLSAVTTKIKKPKPITEEFALGLRIHTDGWSAYMQRGFLNFAENKTQFIWLGIGEKYHPREVKTQNEYFDSTAILGKVPTPYKYGKINNFYQLKLGYGRSKMLSGTLDKKSVVISWNYGVALSLGFLKPYALELIVPEVSDSLHFVRKNVTFYDADYGNYFLSKPNIRGAGTFSSGLSNLQIKPGLLLRSGFNFDFAPSKYAFIDAEIGTMMEMYPKKIDLMVNTNNKAVFFSIYADVHIGKRWAQGETDYE